MSELDRMTQNKRDSLKIMGAIGATCAFPFASDELYGQHAHNASATPAPKPVFFSDAEMKLISVIADLIIPATDTPGAVAAGVPAYIDFVCSRNTELAGTVRQGLAALGGKCDEAKLTELDRTKSPFFRAIKNLTADGYYTSKIGLVDELGYKGNHAIDGFPSCTTPEIG